MIDVKTQIYTDVQQYKASQKNASLNKVLQLYNFIYLQTSSLIIMYSYFSFFFPAKKVADTPACTFQIEVSLNADDFPVRLYEFASKSQKMLLAQGLHS